MDVPEREHILTRDSSYIIYGGGASVVANLVLFRLIGPAISLWLSPNYRHLPENIRMDWNGRFNSNVNALFAIILSSYSLCFETAMHDDKIWHDSFWARLSCAVVVGYMVADSVCMVVWYTMSTGEFISYMFHHAATVYAYYYSSAYGVLCYFAMVRLIAEMSTPTVNQRWFFDILKFPRGHLIVIFNGLMMLMTFFVFRMVAMPIFWYQILQVTGTEELRPLGHVQWIMYIPTFILDALNITWFYKMCRGFVKAVKRLRIQTSTTKEHKVH